MSSESKVNVAIIGLGFGAEFIPIYKKHPNANMYGICRRNEDELKKIGEAFGIENRFTDYQEVLNDPEGDSHANIRNFITYGWEGLKFESPVLNKK